MLKFQINNKIVIFFDHCKLINDAHLENSNNKTATFKLKENLFSFQQKKSTNEEQNCGTTSVGVGKKRKLKLSEELEILKNLSTKAIEHLQSLAIFASNPKTKTTAAKICLERCWEEKHEFPQFHGANNTNDFQTFSFKAAPTTYIIPPKCRFYNHNVLQLTQLLPQLGLHDNDLIVLDPPWRNKYIRRVKRARLESAYNMLDIVDLKSLPIKHLMKSNGKCLVAIWCTNSCGLQKALIEEVLPAWHLKLLHKLPWCKLNTAGQLISNIKSQDSKQPFEMLFIATSKDNETSDEQAAKLQQVKMLLSVPSVIHSHKPPLLNWLREYMTDMPHCLEIFARYLQPQFTSIGLEVIKLMDIRLYEEINSNKKVINV